MALELVLNDMGEDIFSRVQTRSLVGAGRGGKRVASLPKLKRRIVQLEAIQNYNHPDSSYDLPPIIRTRAEEMEVIKALLQELEEWCRDLYPTDAERRSVTSLKAPGEVWSARA